MAAKIEGLCAQHCIITDMCRSGHGNQGAFDEAVRLLRKDYDQFIKIWDGTPGIQYHLVLTVERPKA